MLSLVFALAAMAMSCARSPNIGGDAGSDAAGAPDGDAGDHADMTPDAPLDGGSESPLRLISPLSTSRVTGRAPIVRWEGADRADYVEIQVCAERACPSPARLVCTPTGSCALASVTVPGAYFWRARAVYAGSFDRGWTPTWQFISIANDAPVSSTVGLILDVDGDAHAELMYAAHDPSSGERLWTRYGAARDVPTSVSVDSGDGFRGGSAAGDLNGDGLGDLVIGERQLYDGTNYHNFWSWYPGAPSGLGGAPAARFEPPGVGQSTAPRSIVAFGAGDLNGDGYGDVVAGASGTADDPAAAGGCIFVYPGSATGPSSSSQQLCFADSGLDSAEFGNDIASGGDINGDGFADVVVASGMGVIHLREYLGGSAGLDAPHDVVIPGYSPAQSAFIGDVNGDGYADLGVSGGVGGPAGDAAVFVFLGGTAGLAALPDATVRIVLYGTAVTGIASAVGDLDNDGFDDVAVGNGGARDSAPPLGTVTGMVALFPGSVSGLVSTPSSILFGPDGPNGRFGDHVASSGDTDGDGNADLLVSAHRAFAGSDTLPGDYGGRVYLYPGPILGTPTASSTWAGPAGENYGIWLGVGR